jgi:hypothetical protein
MVRRQLVILLMGLSTKEYEWMGCLDCGRTLRDTGSPKGRCSHLDDQILQCLLEDHLVYNKIIRRALAERAVVYGGQHII